MLYRFGHIISALVGNGCFYPIYIEKYNMETFLFLFLELNLHSRIVIGICIENASFPKWTYDLD